AGNRRQIAGLTALLVVLHQLVNLSPDDLALVRLLVRGDAALEQIPIDLGDRRAGLNLLLAAAHRWLRVFAVAQDLAPHQRVDIARGQRRLVELDAELLNVDCGNVDHSEFRMTPLESSSRSA